MKRIMKRIIISKVFQKEVNGFTIALKIIFCEATYNVHHLVCCPFNNDEVMSDPMNTSIDPNFLLIWVQLKRTTFP